MTFNKSTFLISFGGWYQRTTLHLTEVYDFLVSGSSHLPLAPQRLATLHSQLNLKSVSRHIGPLEFILATSTTGITIRYYEDGLYLLQVKSADPAPAGELLSSYFNDYFYPALSYLFSLGAPTPKLLASIRTRHPTVISSLPGILPPTIGKIYTSITSGDFTVHKSPDYIAITAPRAASTQELIEMQIFFHEFKGQLQKYLDIHRTVWEDISAIKDRVSIKGWEVGHYRGQLDSYQKTISLINNRINQMGSYVHARTAIARDLNLDGHLIKLFQFKFDTLTATLSYIKELWSMTRDYVNSAIQILVEIESKATNRSIKSLQIITTIGVVAGILGYLTRSELPRFSTAGLLFFVLLVIFTLLAEWVVSTIYQNLSYRVKFTPESQI